MAKHRTHSIALKRPGRSGVSRWRDPPRPGTPPRTLPHPDPDLGRQIRGRRLRRGRRGGKPGPGIRGPDRGARAPGRQAGPGARVSKGAQRHGRRSRNAPMSVITGPRASPLPKDADGWGSRVLLNYRASGGSADDTALVESFMKTLEAEGALPHGLRERGGRRGAPAALHRQLQRETPTLEPRLPDTSRLRADGTGSLTNLSTKPGQSQTITGPAYAGAEQRPSRSRCCVYGHAMDPGCRGAPLHLTIAVGECCF